MVQHGRHKGQAFKPIIDESKQLLLN